ncbi:MAG: hypothetical protein WC467_02350 [Patescibacteria group bacterium]
MRLIFKIDKKYDEAMILDIIPRDAKKNKPELAELLRIDIEELADVLQNKKLSLKKAVSILVNNKYKRISAYLKSSALDYQKSWDKMNDDFFKLVSTKTGQAWKYKKYYCIISAYREGISSWGGNIVARRWSINADVQRRMTAHEIVLSHFWTMLENNNISRKWPNKKKWQYSEIFSWCLLGLDKDFIIFWPWLLKKDLFPLNHQYHDLVPLQIKLKDLYFKSNNFVDFFENAIISGK